MHLVASGLSALALERLDLDGDGVQDGPWFNRTDSTSPAEDFAPAIVATQLSDGNRDTCGLGDWLLCTSCALPALAGHWR
jgi:hypothetical protein